MEMRWWEDKFQMLPKMGINLTTWLVCSVVHCQPRHWSIKTDNKTSYNKYYAKEDTFIYTDKALKGR